MTQHTPEGVRAAELIAEARKYANGSKTHSTTVDGWRGHVLRLTEALAAAEARVERLERHEQQFGFSARQRQLREESERTTKALGYSGAGLDCCHVVWRDQNADPNPDEALAAVIDALTQESVPAWSGDGTSIVAQMLVCQLMKAKRARQALEPKP